MTSNKNVKAPSDAEHKSGKHQIKLPDSTRKYIRRLKAEGDLAQATRVRNAALALKKDAQQKQDGAADDEK